MNKVTLLIYLFITFIVPEIHRKLSLMIFFIFLIIFCEFHKCRQYILIIIYPHTLLYFLLGTSLFLFQLYVSRHPLLLLFFFGNTLSPKLVLPKYTKVWSHPSEHGQFPTRVYTPGENWSSLPSSHQLAVTAQPRVGPFEVFPSPCCNVDWLVPTILLYIWILRWS